METISFIIELIQNLCSVPAQIVEQNHEALLQAISGLCPSFLRLETIFPVEKSTIDSFSPRIVYHVAGDSQLNFMLVCTDKAQQLILLGPYITNLPAQEDSIRVLQKNNLNDSMMLPLTEYYSTLPIWENEKAFTICKTCIKYFHSSENIRYEHFTADGTAQPAQLPNFVLDISDELANHVARRYQMEKLLLQEVRFGNKEKALYYYNEFRALSKDLVRHSDPLRNAKNLSFSLNNMLSRSIGRAGVHPIYLDIFSNNFARSIENTANLKELEKVRYEMIVFYCDMVKEYQPTGESVLVRSVVNYIRSHLGEHLSLQNIADHFHVNRYYLSKTFNEDLKISIPNFITQMRILRAAELLRTTMIPIQDIAEFVGFGDPNYFSKCFKQQMCMTPSEYKLTHSLSLSSF